MNSVGQLRPSQVIFTFGVGALTDLPALSVLIMGLDEWDSRRCQEITEERLLAAVKGCIGTQVEALRQPPVDWDGDNLQPSQPGLGVPVSAFPRWLRCPVCGTLATVDGGVFKLQVDPYRPERTCYVHASCNSARGKAPQAVAVRFLRACRHGHLSDLAWFDFVHFDQPCAKGGGGMRLYEIGTADEPADLFAECTACGRKRSLAEAFGRDRYQPACTGFHPHLRRRDTRPCTEEARTVVLGASNSWFPIVLSVLALPRAEDKLGRLIEERWADLKDVTSLEVARFALDPKREPAFAEFSIEDVWSALEVRRAAASLQQPPPADAVDLKTPEWEVFTHPNKVPKGHRDFQLREVAPPFGFEHYFERTVLAERLREVRALIGFNRIESRGDFTDAEAAVDDRRSPLSRNPEQWVPATEVRGEGLFLQFREKLITDWLAQTEAQGRQRAFFAGHRQWRQLRRITPADGAFPGLRYVLLHSFSHALLRQLALECGYSAASLRERIYSRDRTDGAEPMAGVLLYTAASDSEGTLGGLVSLGEPTTLGRILRGTFAAMSLCGSDPLCAEHEPNLNAKTIHGACCHACLFSSETSCERGNRYLDRATLVPTFKDADIAFFKTSQPKETCSLPGEISRLAVELGAAAFAKVCARLESASPGSTAITTLNDLDDELAPWAASALRTIAAGEPRPDVLALVLRCVAATADETRETPATAISFGAAPMSASPRCTASNKHCAISSSARNARSGSFPSPPSVSRISSPHFAKPHSAACASASCSKPPATAKASSASMPAQLSAMGFRSLLPSMRGRSKAARATPPDGPPNSTPNLPSPTATPLFFPAPISLRTHSNETWKPAFSCVAAHSRPGSPNTSTGSLRAV